MKKSTSHFLRWIGDKAVIVALDRDNANIAQVYDLNDTASAMWEHLGDGEIDARSLAQWLCAHYDIDMPTALADVRRQLDEWAEYGLIN